MLVILKVIVKMLKKLVLLLTFTRLVVLNLFFLQRLLLLFRGNQAAVNLP